MLDQGTSKQLYSHSQKTVLNNVVHGWGQRTRTFSSDYYLILLACKTQLEGRCQTEVTKGRLSCITGCRAQLTDKGNQKDWGTKQECNENAVKRNVLKPCLSDLTLLSGLETTVSATFLILASYFCTSKCTLISGMKSIDKNRKVNSNDKNDIILTETWRVSGDCESICKLQRFLGTVKNILLRLLALQGREQHSNNGHWYECPMYCSHT